jgi:hypothetical protein
VNFTAYLGSAYAIMGLVGIAAYWPQFRTLWQSTAAARLAPLSTWVMWGVQTSVTFLYAVFVNRDHIFILLTFLGMSVTLACLGVLLWQRRRKLPPSAEIIPFHPRPRTPQAPLRPRRDAA